MTTPPTTAGWYPDPDGSGGQRHWDGAAWTTERTDTGDAATGAEETAAWPVELPPWPEDMKMPSWDDAGKAEPVIPVEETLIEEPVAEGSAVEETAVEDPEPSDQPAVVIPVPEQPTLVIPMLAAPPEPVAVASAAAPTMPDTPARPLKWYLAGAAALLVVLVGVLVWAFAFADPGTGTTEATGAGETAGTAETAGTGPTTDSADPPESTGGGTTGAGVQALDGDVTITSNGVEITPTVSAADNDLLTTSASGQFVVVRLTLLNNGELPATFLADQQVLTAGGQTYSAETESTFYLGGISAVLYPGQPVTVAFAYDVPPGTAPESLQVHGDLGSAGAIIELA